MRGETLIEQLEARASEYRNKLGGSIFAFPIDEDDPFSLYVVSVYTGSGFRTYDNPLTIEEAAAGILETLNGFKSIGIDDDYDRNVRFISCEAQINAPSVTMRRLRKEDYLNSVEEEVEVLTACGVILVSYFGMVDDKLPKAAEFMKKYYQLLSMRKYGKTASAIKQEVHRMNKDQAARWIRETYKKYIKDDMEIMNILQSLKEKSSPV